MNSEKRDLISNIANEIRSILNINTDNFNINDIVNSLNGSIVNDSFSLDEATIVKSSNENFTIHLNNTSNPQRARFSIAHELGHLFLHMNYLNFDEWERIEVGTSHSRNTTIPYTIYESEANEFAASFLMPKDRFIQVAEQNIVNNCYDLSEIANTFNVSREAVAIRGKILGIWE